MNSFVDALNAKMSMLQDEREELQDSIIRIESKLEILNELLLEEIDVPVSSTPLPLPKNPVKKRGRPKGSKNKTSKRTKKGHASTIENDPVLEDALQMEGTNPEVAERLSKRKFVPQQRPKQSYGPGIYPGIKPDPSGKDTNADVVVSVGDDE